MRFLPSIILACLCVAPVAASAQERDYCSARPGLGTPACTTAPGRASVEVGLADWSRDGSAGDRVDVVLIGDTLVRLGVANSVEMQVGWTPFGQVRSRDRSGLVRTERGVGDVYLGVSANLANPDGSGLSIAVQPFATLPVGGVAIGAGDWSAGLVVPISYDLGRGLSLQFTGEIDAATDGDRSGRHVAYSGVVGLGLPLSDTIGATVEVQGARDEDPAGHGSQWLAAISLGWLASERLQFDVGANLGLNRDAPDAQIYFGISRRL